MAINKPYKTPNDLPRSLPVFPLEGALLLPRCQLPLNIFEPRYLAMFDDAIAGDRLIGMIQPDFSGAAGRLCEVGCVGRITQFAESGDGRLLVTLTGVARFRMAGELKVDTLYRQAKIDTAPFRDDFHPNVGADAVDRDGLLHTLATYLEVNKLEADWDSIKEAPNEALVNGLSMMAPFGVREKQALLEAPSLKNRAEILVAITEMALTRTIGDPDTPLQ